MQQQARTTAWMSSNTKAMPWKTLPAAHCSASKPKLCDAMMMQV